MCALKEKNINNHEMRSKHTLVKELPNDYIIHASVTELSETDNSYYMLHINNENIGEDKLEKLTDIVTDIYNGVYKYVTHISKFRVKHRISLMYFDKLCKFTVTGKSENRIEFIVKFNV